MPNSSIRSRTAPHSRQIKALQSPQTKGAATARAQFGQ